MAGKDRQQMMVFILSILAAFVLWTYVMSDKNPIQTRVIENIPVTLTSLDSIEQSNLAIVANQDFTVNLTVTGRALDIFNISLADFKVTADMSGYLKRGDNNIPVEIKSTPKGINVINKNGYTYIKVRLDTLAERAVPVTITVNGYAKQGYGYMTPVVRPTEIMVSGPETYVNSVSAASGQIDISGNYSSVSGSIPLKIQDRYGKVVPFINSDTKYIDVTVPIKPSKEVPVVVKTKGQIKDGKILLSAKPRIQRITVIGDKEYLDRVKSIETVAYNISKITETTSRDIPLNLPYGVAVANGLGVVSVDFTLEDREEKQFEVPITILNENKDLKYSLQNSTVGVTLLGSPSVLSEIDDKDLSAVIDVDKVLDGVHTLPIKISVPNNAQIKSGTMDKVTVTITKK